MNSRITRRRIAAGLGIAAILSMGTLTACGGGGNGGPSSTSTTTPSPSPTEKSLSPTGGNLFTPPVKAPPAPTAIPGTNHTN